LSQQRPERTGDPAGAPHVRVDHRAPDGVRLSDLLSLERVDDDRFTAGTVFPFPWPLYGGQVAAQALVAAAATLAADRVPHSLHAYFLEQGTTTLPVDFTVERDRDGRSFSARRVVARQGGRPLLTLSASFTVDEFDPQDDLQVAQMPPVQAPTLAHAPEWLVEFERSVPRQAHPLPGMPTRFWARCTADLGDESVLPAAVLTYLSDLGTGHEALPGSASRVMASMDHAMWFHRPAQVGEWVLVDFATSTVGRGRGHYAGTMWLPDGTLVASLAQETLYRRRRRPRTPG
jgi:acyl-CoA thioesterase-2